MHQASLVAYTRITGSHQLGLKATELPESVYNPPTWRVQAVDGMTRSSCIWELS